MEDLFCKLGFLILCFDLYGMNIEHFFYSGTIYELFDAIKQLCGSWFFFYNPVGCFYCSIEQN